MWKGLASKGIVDETQRNSEIIKVNWSDVVEDLTGSNKKKKKKKRYVKTRIQSNEDSLRKNVNQR